MPRSKAGSSHGRGRGTTQATKASRFSLDELGEEEVRFRVSLLTRLEADKVFMEVVVEPFHLPPEEVNILL